MEVLALQAGCVSCLDRRGLLGVRAHVGIYCSALGDIFLPQIRVTDPEIESSPGETVVNWPGNRR